MLLGHIIFVTHGKWPELCCDAVDMFANKILVLFMGDKEGGTETLTDPWAVDE